MPPSDGRASFSGGDTSGDARIAIGPLDGPGTAPNQRRFPEWQARFGVENPARETERWRHPWS